MTTEARFYISIVPGLETAAYLELCEVLSQEPFLCEQPSVQTFKGGIEVRLPVAVGLGLNRYLRLSSRILMRVLAFDAPRIRQFKVGMEAFPWLQFFKKGSSVNLQFSSRSSKLSVKKQILRELEPVLRNKGLRWGSEGPKLFVRLFRDHCEISMDTTGERGQFRGEGKKVGSASLRDTTGAGLVRILLQGVDRIDLQELTLVDPMAGSGTFLLEGLAFRQPLVRNFLCEQFPIFNHKRFPRPKAYGDRKVSLRVIGFERDLTTSKKGKLNFSSYPEKSWCWHTMDFREASEAELIPQNAMVIVNPPWGRRLPEEKDPLWLENLLRLWKPRRLGILWNQGKIPRHEGYDRVRQVWIENSGLRNQFSVLVPGG